MYMYNAVIASCVSIACRQVNPKFTCFTSTKVQILTPTRVPGKRGAHTQSEVHSLY